MPRLAGAALASWLLPFAFADSKPLTLTAEEQRYYDDLRDFSNEYFAQRLKAPPDRDGPHTLHPKFQYHLEKYSRGVPGGSFAERLSTPEGVAAYRYSVDRVWSHRSFETAPMRKTEDVRIDGPGGTLEARVYTPAVPSAPAAGLPVLVYFHGGGFMGGSLIAVDPAVRLIANDANVIVVSANYRLSPEHTFPAAQDDALAVYRWVRARVKDLGGDARRIAIGGDSAGGQLAVVTTLRSLEASEAPPVYQLLYYPVVDADKEKYGSMDKFRNGFGLNEEATSFFTRSYYPNPEDRTHPHASPIRARTLRGFPPALVVTANFDLLRDQGKAYVERLRNEGVPARWLNYGSLIHGFMQHSRHVDAARDACRESARIFGEALRALK
jgi:acetyl esterase